ncbi:MAG TPA: tetratricopeptide repeat protein [Longimicrobiales bacterium]
MQPELIPPQRVPEQLPPPPSNGLAGAQSSLEARARELHEERDPAALALLLAGTDRSVVIASPSFAFWLADAWRRLGRGAEALALLAEAAPAFARYGNDALHRHRLNLEGMLRFDAGEVAAAESSWRALLAAASEAADDDFVARANNNLGVICTLHGRWQEAITCYERALVAYRSIGRRRGLAQAHQNLAITYRELDFAPKADHHFLQAIRYASVDASEDEIARAEQERALLIYIAQHDAALARATAQRALTRFEQLGERGATADTLRVLGIIEIGEGQLERATRLLNSALERARDARLPIVEAETLEALAAVLEQRRDVQLAATLRRDAEHLFGRIGATAWGRRTRSRIARIALRAAPARS